MRPKSKRTAVLPLNLAVNYVSPARVRTKRGLETKKKNSRKRPRRTKTSTSVLCRERSTLSDGVIQAKVLQRVLTVVKWPVRGVEK